MGRVPRQFDLVVAIVLVSARDNQSVNSRRKIREKEFNNTNIRNRMKKIG